MYGSAIPKLANLPTEALIQTCLQAIDITDAGALLGVERKTIRNELSRRGLPAFADLRKQHGIEPNLGGGVAKWTDAAVERMRELHLQGLSAQLIGEKMGLSKNAVCGKAHRIGLVLGVPHTKKAETKPRAPRPPSTLKGKPRPPRKAAPVLPATNALGGSRRPMVLASGARKLAAARLAQQSRASDRALIDAAIAAGKVTKLPSGHAWGTKQNSWAQVGQS